MFKALLKNQIRSVLFTMFMAKRSKNRSGIKSAGKKVLVGLLTLYVVGCMFFFFGMMFYQLASPLIAGGLDTVYFVLVGLMTFLFMFIGSIFITQKQLYEANDNELLLSMPIPPLYIVLTRIFAVLTVNLLYGAFMVLPAFIVYSVISGFSFATLLIMLFASLLLSVLALAISAVCGWLLALITSNIKRKNIFSTVIMMAFFLGIMAFYVNLQNILQKLVTEGAALADALRKIFPPLYYYGESIAQKNVLSLVLLALISVIPTAIIIYLISKSFIRVATMKKGSGNYKYTAKRLNASSPRKSLFFKEFKRFFSSTNYFMNAGLGSIFMYILAIALAVKGVSLIPADTLSQLPDTIPVDYLFPLAVGAIVLFCTTTNCSSCSSLSLEGKFYPSLRAMPLSYYDIIIPKIAVNFVWGAVSALPVVIVCALRLGFSLRNCFFILLLAVAAQFFTAVWGMACNIFFPRFDWISEVMVIKQSASSLLGILGSMAIMGVLVFAVMIFGFNSESLSIDTLIRYALPGLSAFYAVMSAAVIAVLATAGKKKFNSLSA